MLLVADSDNDSSDWQFVSLFDGVPKLNIVI
jgi:hypothetical protein